MPPILVASTRPESSAWSETNQRHVRRECVLVTPSHIQRLCVTFPVRSQVPLRVERCGEFESLAVTASTSRGGRGAAADGAALRVSHSRAAGGDPGPTNGLV